MDVYNPQFREQAAQYAEKMLSQAVPGLAERIRSGAITPDDQILLQRLQQHAPKEANKIGLVLQVLQHINVGIQQRVQAVQSVSKLPQGLERAQGLINSTTAALSKLGGHPHQHVRTLAGGLAKKNPKKLEALYLFLATPQASIAGFPVLETLALAMQIVVNDNPSVDWIVRNPASLSFLDANISTFQSTSPPTLATPVARQPFNGDSQRGPHGTLRDQGIVGPPTAAPLPNLSPAPATPTSLPGSVIGSGNSFNALAALNQAPQYPNTGQAAADQGPDYLAFDFDAATPSAPAPIPIEQKAWSDLMDFQVIQRLSGIASQSPSIPDFEAACRTAFTEVVTKVPSVVSGISLDLSLKNPDPSLQIMMRILLEVTQQYEPVLRQRRDTEPFFASTYKSIELACESMSKRLRLAPQIAHYYDYIPKDPGGMIKYLRQLGPMAMTDEIADTIMAIKAAFEICPRSEISSHLLKFLQKDISGLDARRDLAPALLREEQGKVNGYKIGQFLAQGGMGAVFLADQITFDKPTGTLVAVKLSLADDDDSKRAFFREARILSGIKGDHIVQVHASGTTADGNPYLVMEYVPGYEEGSGAYDGHAFMQMLRESNENGSPVPNDALAIVSWKLFYGVKEFQDQGIVQRDLKPANFLMTPEADLAFAVWREDGDDDKLVATLHQLVSEGNPLIKWTDFGLAKRMDQVINTDLDEQGIQDLLTNMEAEGEITPQSSFTLTADDCIVGTPGYMTPEMATGEPEDRYTDQFALGIILFQLFSGGQWPTDKPNTAMGLVRDGLTLGCDGRPTYVDEKDVRIAHLMGWFSRTKKLPALMGSTTNLNFPEDRGEISDVTETLRIVAMSSTEEAKAARQLRLQLSLLAATLIPLILALILVFVNMRSDEDVSHGGQRIAWLDKASNLDGKTVVQLRSLLSDLKALLDGIPEGYEVEGEEPLGSSLRSKKTAIEARITQLETTAANRRAAELLRTQFDLLVTQGDALLTGETPDFAGARTKYAAALAICISRAPEINAKLDRVDRMDMKAFYSAGLRAYHRGEIAVATRSFVQVRRGLGRNVNGLSEAEQATFTRFEGLLNGWEQRFNGLNIQAVRNLGWTFTNSGEMRINMVGNLNWQTAVDQWLARGLSGRDPDSMTKFFLTFTGNQQAAGALVQAPNMPSNPIADQAAHRLTQMLELLMGNADALLRVKNMNPRGRTELQQCFQYAIIHQLNRMKSFDLAPNMTAAQKLAERRVLIVTAFQNYIYLSKAIRGMGCTVHPYPEELQPMMEHQLDLVIALLGDTEKTALRNIINGLPDADQFPIIKTIVDRAG
jgi:serine/threonine protein kinase